MQMPLTPVTFKLGETLTEIKEGLKILRQASYLLYLIPENVTCYSEIRIEHQNSVTYTKEQGLEVRYDK
jgi:hypothetical protein